MSQERLCREYAIKEGLEVAEVFIEKGESAKTANRTQLNLLLKFCTKKKGAVQAVIAYKVDRISRNIADYTVIRATLKKYGVEIRSVTEFFEDTPAGRFMENIIANVGQFDNDVRAERSIGGMREATEDGRYVWRGPIGYSNVKINNLATITPNQYAPLIKRVFELILTRQYSTDAIRLMVAKEGLVNKKGKAVSHSNFFRILRNPLYKGVINKFGKNYEGTFDAIVSPEVFDKAQAILKGRKNITVNYLSENPDFPLRRFVVDEDGDKITGYWSKGKRLKYPYYSFKKPKTTVRKEVFEESFMEFLSKFSFTTENLDRMHYHLKEQFEVKTKNRKDGKEGIQKQINTINEQIDKLITLQDKGAISMTTFAERAKKHEDDLESLKGLLTKNVEQKYNINGLMKFAEKALKKPHLLWKNVSFELQKKLVVFDFPKGLVYDGIKFRTPQMCNVFKLKEEFDKDNVLSVPLKESTKNTPLKRNSINLLNNEAFWEQIVKELEKIKEILSD